MSQMDLMGRTVYDATWEAYEIIRVAKDAYPGALTFALFSGGNDSTTLLHLARTWIDAAVHINTGIGIEQTRDFVRRTCETWGVPLIEKRTDPEWYRQDVIAHGFPGPVQHRVMYHQLKRERLRDLARENPGRKLILLTGERAYESQRRMGYGNTTMRTEGRFVWVNPIHFFDTRLMNDYRERFDVPRNEVADLLHRSGECLCGAFAQPEELDEIRLWFPETAAYIDQLGQEARANGVPEKRCRWAWGNKGSRPAPGPLCSSCQLFDPSTSGGTA